MHRQQIERPACQIKAVRSHDRARLSVAYQRTYNLRSDPAAKDTDKQITDDPEVVSFDRRTDHAAAHAASNRLEYEASHSAPH
jgi:hypothetical protein